MVLNLVVSRGWSLHQLDVNNTFLQGHFSEDVFMAQPPNFLDHDIPTHVCKLPKTIYGLKQAPRAWYHELRQFLVPSGFTNSRTDTSLFLFNNSGNLVFLLTYVDDIIITGCNFIAVQRFINLLGKRFFIKDLGDLTYFLGVEVATTSNGLLLSQLKYITDLLTRTNMIGAKLVTTPLATEPTLIVLFKITLTNPSEYRIVVGSLQYLCHTCPDIAYVLNKLSQFMHRPTIDHWNFVKRLLRYLSSIVDHGLAFHHHISLSLHAFSDANWANNKDD